MIGATAFTVFWMALALLVYVHAGYPVVLFVCYGIAQMKRDFHYLNNRRDRRRAGLSDAQLPSVTMLFAAYNEEEHLAEKLENTIQLDYPAEKLQVVLSPTDRRTRPMRFSRGLTIPVLKS